MKCGCMLISCFYVCEQYGDPPVYKSNIAFLLWYNFVFFLSVIRMTKFVIFLFCLLPIACIVQTYIHAYMIQVMHFFRLFLFAAKFFRWKFLCLCIQSDCIGIISVYYIIKLYILVLISNFFSFSRRKLNFMIFFWISNVITNFIWKFWNLCLSNFASGSDA